MILRFYAYWISVLYPPDTLAHKPSIKNLDLPVAKLKKTRTPPRETEQQIFPDDMFWRRVCWAHLCSMSENAHVRTSAYAGTSNWLLCQGCRCCLEIKPKAHHSQSQCQAVSSWKSKFVAFHQSEFWRRAQELPKELSRWFPYSLKSQNNFWTPCAGCGTSARDKQEKNEVPPHRQRGLTGSLQWRRSCPAFST